MTSEPFFRRGKWSCTHIPPHRAGTSDLYTHPAPSNGASGPVHTSRLTDQRLMTCTHILPHRAGTSGLIPTFHVTNSLVARPSVPIAPVSSISGRPHLHSAHILSRWQRGPLPQARFAQGFL